MNPITKSYLSDSYEVYCVDYCDDIDAPLMAKCLKNKDASTIWEQFYIADDMSVWHIANDIKERMTADGHAEIFEDDEYEIHDWISEHDTSNPIRDLCRNSRYAARIVQHSNHDCWVPPYDMGFIAYDGVFKEVVDMLALNPAEVKKHLCKWADCKGRWPNRPKRNPIVDAKRFSDCCLNNPNYGLWGFFGMVKGGFLYENNFQVYPKDVIPKGTVCGWCNWWNGGGSLDLIETIRDVSLEELTRNLRSDSEYTKVEFELDEKGACNGYAIMPEVYAATYEDPIFK